MDAKRYIHSKKYGTWPTLQLAKTTLATSASRDEIINSLQEKILLKSSQAMIIYTLQCWKKQKKKHLVWKIIFIKNEGTAPLTSTT